MATYKIDNGNRTYDLFSATAAADAIRDEMRRGIAPTVYELRECSDGRRTVREWHRIDRGTVDAVKYPKVLATVLRLLYGPVSSLRILSEKVARMGGIYDTKKYRYVVDGGGFHGYTLRRIPLDVLGTTASLSEPWEIVYREEQ